MSRRALAGGRLRHLDGWRKDRPDRRDYLVSEPRLRTPIAARSDLRAKMSAIQDQGPIGSCTAQTGCEQMEFLEGQGRSDRLFSRLYLYARTRKLEGTPLANDSGAEMRDVMAALAKTGVCLDATWPYEPSETRFALEPTVAADAEAAQYKALFYYRCPSLRTLRASLCQGFPVGFGFSVPENMMSAECAASGMVHLPRGTEGFTGGHAVTAVGHDDTFVIDGVRGAVLCQNHWGVAWGIQGYFWLPYGFFERLLADDLWTLRRAEV